MSCICQARQLSESHKTHSFECEQYQLKTKARKRENNIRERAYVEGYKDGASDIDAQKALEKWAWENQDKPCSGTGYAHKAHGKCPGFVYDRT